jgi:WD40 repeat protein
MRVAWACLGMVAACALGCGDKGIDKVARGTIPDQGMGGAAASAPVGSAAPGNAVDQPVSMGGQPGPTDQPGHSGAGGHPNGCCFSPMPMGGTHGTGGMGGEATGGMGMAGMGAGGMAGAGGMVGGPSACSSFTVGSAMTLPPAASGQAYLRCGTLGPERGWLSILSPSGDRLAARTAAGTVRLISTSTWTEVAQLASPVGELDAMAFSPDGTLLATLSLEMGQVAIWRAQDGAYQASYATPPAATIDANGAALAFSSTGRLLATSTGDVIDLTTGTKTSWSSGAPDPTTLAANPENLKSIDAGGIPFMRFTAGDSRLFIVTNYQIGNSPPSTQLELRDFTTGAQTVLFSAYSRALLGYAISDDGRYIARGSTIENGASTVYGQGLVVIDATTGALVVSDATATSTSVLAFSHDGSRLYTQTGTTVATVGTTDLHGIASFTWPTGTTFVALSPGEDLLGTAGGSTSYFDPATGAVVRTLAFPLTSAVWTADGRFADGSGDPSVLFHFWVESSGAQLCDPAAGTGSAPPIASLGTTIPPNQTTNPTTSTTATSADGSITGTETYLIHGHSANFYADSLSVTSSGALLRQFGAFTSAIDPMPFLAFSTPDAAKAYTPAVTAMQAPGADVAVWCR